MKTSLVSKNSMTPAKDRGKSQSKTQETNKFSENLNPNVYHSSPAVKPTSSPLTKSAKSQKSVPKITNPVAFSPRNKLHERKFVVAKKNSKKEKHDDAVSRIKCKCKERFGAGNMKKCLCVAYENLRASQELFFKKDENYESGNVKGIGEETEKVNLEAENLENGDGSESENQHLIECESPGKNDSSTTKRRRAKLVEEARKSAAENGKVMHLVKEFEKLLSIPNSKESDRKEDDEKGCVKNDVKTKAMKWAVPGQQTLLPLKSTETRETSCPSFYPSDLILTAENLGLDSRASVSSSWDSGQGRISNGGRKSRRNSSESCGTIGSRRWKRQQLKVTSQKPFELRTEQRGRMKEEEFMKKIQEMVQVEEKLRVPIAQGLPWTTDEPECLIKPPVKDNTKPLDLKLRSDIRAVERAEFDQQVTEKMSLIEQYKMERERQHKMQEEEEIRRLRKELVSKAQPMPYFDRPFIPRRPVKHPTIPREPKFHIPQQKKIKCYLSWNDTSSPSLTNHRSS